MGLDILLYDWNVAVKEKSEHFPHHHCEKGYLRSSYHGNSFNTVVGTMLGKELYYIFDPLDGEDDQNGEVIHPVYSKKHLNEALVRAKEVRDGLEQMIPFKVSSFSDFNAVGVTKREPIRSLSPFHAYRAFQAQWQKKDSPVFVEAFDYFNRANFPIYATVLGMDAHDRPTVFAVSKLWDEWFVHSFPYADKANSPDKQVRKFTSSSEVLSLFHVHEKMNPQKNYSCGDGDFYLRVPLQAHGIIAGIDEFGHPALHFIHQLPTEAFKRYKQQAMIIIEFIEKALTLEHPRIVWCS